MTWENLFQANPSIRLRGPVDQDQLFKPLFEYADQLAGGANPQESSDAIIQEALRAMGAPVAEPKVAMTSH